MNLKLAQIAQDKIQWWICSTKGESSGFVTRRPQLESSLPQKPQNSHKEFL